MIHLFNRKFAVKKKEKLEKLRDFLACFIASLRCAVLVLS